MKLKKKFRRIIRERETWARRESAAVMLIAAGLILALTGALLLPATPESVEKMPLWKDERS